MTEQGFTPELVIAVNKRFAFCTTSENLLAVEQRWNGVIVSRQKFTMPTAIAPIEIHWIKKGTDHSAICRSFYDLRKRIQNLVAEGFEVTLTAASAKNKARATEKRVPVTNFARA